MPDLEPFATAVAAREGLRSRGPQGLADVRRLNLQRVLFEIRDRPGLTRKDLVVATSLNRVTILDLVADLQHRNLVGEHPSVSTGRSGRPAMTLSLDDGHLAVAAIEVNVDRMRIMVSSLQLRVLYEETVSMTGEELDPAHVLGMAAASVNRARAALAERGLQIKRVCIGIPAFIDHRNGTVMTSLNFGWTDVPVVEILRHATDPGLGFTLDRLANLAIREERALANLPPDSGIVLLYGDMGVGGAFQKGAAILRGDSGSGAEFGHISVDPSGPRCYCGNRGCLEMHVGIRPLANALGIVEGSEGAVMQRVLGLLQAEEPEAVAAAQSQVPWLARALWTLRTVFDPRTLILGGHLAAIAHRMDRLLTEELPEEAWGTGTELIISAMGANAVLAGGVRAARDDLLAAPLSA